MSAVAKTIIQYTADKGYSLADIIKLTLAVTMSCWPSRSK